MIMKLADVVSICWAIWGARNATVMEGVKRDCADVLEYAISSDQEVWNAKESSLVHNVTAARGVQDVKWQPPDVGVKINVDAGLMGELGNGLGAFIRANSGCVLAAGVVQGSEKWDSSLAEAKAIIWELNCAATLGFQEVTIESDCLLVISTLRNKTTDFS